MLMYPVHANNEADCAKTERWTATSYNYLLFCSHSYKLREGQQVWLVLQSTQHLIKEKCIFLPNSRQSTAEKSAISIQLRN